MKYDAGDSTVEVVLGNVALFETENGADIENKVVVSLVNLEEESTLKNTRGYQRTASDGLRFRQPPVYLNLYLLFCCNYTQYQPALKRLSLVLTFFQTRKSFDVASAMGSLGGRQLPSLMYKARLVKVEDPNAYKELPPIEEIEKNLNPETP